MTASRRRAAVLVAAALTALQPLAAQRRPVAEHRTPRKVLFTLAGAAIGTIASAAYFGGNDDPPPGLCSASSCVITMSVGGGAFLGYLIGREFDQLHELRYRGGTPLDPPSVSVPLSGEPSVLAVRDSLVVVGGLGGVQVFASGVSLRAAGKRATGVRGIETIDLAPGVGAIVLGSSSGAYLYPPRTGPGTLLREGASAAAVATVGRIYFATHDRIESAPLSADTVRSWPGITVGRKVTALHFDEPSQVLYAVADSTLYAFKPAADSLEKLGEVAIGATARHVDVDGHLLAMAMGEGGVRLYDVSTPGGPRPITNWNGARFAYDVSLVGTRLYVAAGVEGVYVLDVSGTEIATLGLARELGFATALASRDGFTYLLDRSVNALRRIHSDF